MLKKQKKFNRVISAKVATSIILLALLISSAVVWSQTKDDQQFDTSIQVDISSVQALKDATKNKNNDIADSNACTPHYYDGEATVGAWAQQITEDGLIMQIDAQYIAKLPTNNNHTKDPLAVKLIDPTDKIKKQLIQASAKNPATVILQGFADICEGSPVVSLQPATLAFKKS